MTVTVYQGDLPDDYDAGELIAIDTETQGLNLHRDRLCVVQLSRGDGNAELVQISAGQSSAPNLQRILSDPQITKIFHYARFDVAVLLKAFGVLTTPVYCTKIASKLVRTYTDRHGLKDLISELLGDTISKQQQSSDWARETLSEDQQAYAAGDVLYLHQLKARLDDMLARENRTVLARACFAFVPTRAGLDLAGFECVDIFAHR